MSAIKRISGYLDKNPKNSPFPFSWILRFFQNSIKVYREFVEDQCYMRAAGLAFACLLALVPFSAVNFALLSAFGAFENFKITIQKFLYEQLVPTIQEDIMLYVEQFIDNSKALGIVGIIFFSITSIFLLNTINKNFNTIWGTKSQKNFLIQFSTYISVIIVSTLLISASFNLRPLVRSLLSFPITKEFSIISKFFLNISPTIFIALTFMFLIKIIPSGRINFSSALIGAITGAFLWSIAKIAFSYWVNSVIRISVVYGSLAAIPIFLLWLYIAWIIILIALETSFVHQQKRRPWAGINLKSTKPIIKLILGMEVFLYIAKKFREGKPAPDYMTISKHFSISIASVNFFVHKFVDKNLLIYTNENYRKFLPAKAISTINIKELILCLGGDIGNKQNNFEESQSYLIVKKFYDDGLKEIQNISIEDILSSDNSIENIIESAIKSKS